MEHSRMTEQELKELRELPKTIQAKTPRHGFREEGGHRRCDLTLRASGDLGLRFDVFFRQTTRYIENFSLGLVYHTGDSDTGP